MRYRKKPVVIDAWPVRGLLADIEKHPSEVPDCVADAISQGTLQPYGTGISVVTLEGTMEGTGDDYLIRGIEGEFYPCRRDIFENSYEPESVRQAVKRPMTGDMHLHNPTTAEGDKGVGD